MAKKSYRPRRKKRSLFKDLLLTTIFLGGIAYATVWLDDQSSQEFSGKIYVVDGDSLVINEEKLRLVGIDAPELRQTCTKNGRDWPCGRESRQALRSLVKQGGVVCTSEGLDKYERWLVACRNGAGSINAEMVRLGWALAYGRYAALEKSPRVERKGIWVGEFERPQEWREAQRGSLASVVSLNANVVVSKLRGIKKRFLW